MGAELFFPQSDGDRTTEADLVGVLRLFVVISPRRKPPVAPASGSVSRTSVYRMAAIGRLPQPGAMGEQGAGCHDHNICCNKNSCKAPRVFEAPAFSKHHVHDNFDLDMVNRAICVATGSNQIEFNSGVYCGLWTTPTNLLIHHEIFRLFRHIRALSFLGSGLTQRKRR